MKCISHNTRIRRKRIGNDLRFNWTILDGENPYDLEGKNLLLMVKSPLGSMPYGDLLIDGNVISFTLYGKDQKTNGLYTAILVENPDEVGMRTVDITDIVMLVPHTKDEGGEDRCSHLSVETIDLTSQMIAGVPGKSAYESWLATGHTGSEEDFVNWLKADITRENIENALDSEEGKNLSTNDYTDEDKDKLEGIEDGAQVNVQSDWDQNDSSKAGFIKGKTHWEEESRTTINDAKLAWSGSTSEDIDFWLYDTDIHIPSAGFGHWELSWENGGIIIDDNGGWFLLGILNDGEWEYPPFDPLYDSQPYPLGVDIVITSGKTVHKLHNKFLDMDSAPTTGSGKPVTSGGVKAAIAGFITRTVDDLANYYLKSETYTKAEVESLIGDIQKVVRFPPNTFGFNGTDSSVSITPITLSQNGDSIEVGIIKGKTETSINVGYPFTQGGANNGIGLALSATRVSLRSDDGDWLINNQSFSIYIDHDDTNYWYNLIIKYEDNIINCYVNGNLVTTYQGQKTVTIKSVGNGAVHTSGTRAYGYWKGIVTKFLYTHGGVTKGLSSLPGYAVNNITTETLRENILAEVAGDSNSIAAKIRPMPYFAGQAPSSFINKILASNKDIEILLSGDSVTGFSHVADAIKGAENLPAGCQYDSLTYQLWNGLCANKQQCDRYDSRVNSFTETGTWVLVDPKKLNNAVSGGPSTNGNKGEFSPANSIFRQGSPNATVSFSFDTDAYEKMNIVHLKGLDGTNEATLSCVSGKLEVYDRTTGQWVEANGYAFSQSTLIDGAVPQDSNIHSHWVRNVALKFRKASGATGSVTVTVTNTGTGYLYYWGTERWSGNTARVINCGKGGRTTSLLMRTINDDITERDIDLVIWQVPLWNEMKAGGAYNTNYDPSHTIFLDTLKTLSDNFVDFQVIVWYPHTQVADWVGDKNLQFQANGLVDRPKTDLTSCEHINKSQAAIINYDSAVKVVNLGILAKDFANSIGYTMQGILYTDGSGEDIGDGTESGDIDTSGRLTVDGTHLSTSGCKFFTELMIPMFRIPANNIEKGVILEDDGYYPDMRVGQSKSLKGTEVTQVEGISTIAKSTGIAKINEVMGRSLVWNQLVNPIAAETETKQGVTCVKNNGVFTFNGTRSGEGNTSFLILASGSSLTFVSGHKYLIRGCYPGGSDTTYRIWLSSSTAFPANHRLYDTGAGKIETALADETLNSASLFIQFVGSSTFTLTNAVFIPEIVDLTKEFGPGYEPATVAEYNALSPLIRPHSYNPGEIISNNTEKLEITGLNQWDEEWEVGAYYNATNGNKSSAAANSTNLNPVKLLPNTNYFFHTNKADSGSIFVVFFDSLNQYCGYVNVGTSGKQFTPPTNAAYCHFNVTSAFSSTGGKVCISVSGSRNGEYEPYQKSELELNLATITGKLNGEGESVVIFPDGMRSTGTVYDSLIVDEDEWCRRAVRRLTDGLMENFSWRLYGQMSGINCWTVDNLGLKGGNNILSVKYPTSTSIVDKTIRNQSMVGAGTLWCYDNSYSTVTEFKAGLAGQKLIYPLSTPQEYVLDTPIFMGIKTEQGGVIRQLPENGSEPTTAPMRMDIVYALPPEALMSGGSIRNMLEALKAAGKINTYTMAWDYTIGKWTFSFT